jgi:hypothetical protein
MTDHDPAVAALAARLLAALRSTGRAEIDDNPASLDAVTVKGSCDFLLLARTALDAQARTSASLTPDQLNAANDE